MAISKTEGFLYPANMTRAALDRAISKADAEHSQVLDAMIAAGRGHERPSETASKSDALSVRFNASLARCGALQSELSRRMAYHGTAHRIKGN